MTLWHELQQQRQHYPYCTATMEAEPSLGMRLDAAIAKVDKLSSTQMYGIIVSVIIVLSFLILGPAPDNSLQPILPEEEPRKVKVISSNGREPRWHIFRWVNYATVFAFCWSVIDFGMHYSDYLQDSDAMLKFLAAWSILVCYFFAFFGISFVHDSIESNDQVIRTAADQR